MIIEMGEKANTYPGEIPRGVLFVVYPAILAAGYKGPLWAN